MIRFELPTVPPSANDEGQRGQHWSGRSRARRLWHDKATALLLAQRLKLARDPEQPCIVTHTFECRGDGANREKLATDFLVRAGLLHDDRWPWLFEVRVRGRRMTRGEWWTCEIVDCDHEGRTT